MDRLDRSRPEIGENSRSRGPVGPVRQTGRRVRHLEVASTQVRAVHNLAPTARSRVSEAPALRSTLARGASRPCAQQATTPCVGIRRLSETTGRGARQPSQCSARRRTGQQAHAADERRRASASCVLSMTTAARPCCARASSSAARLCGLHSRCRARTAGAHRRHAPPGPPSSRHGCRAQRARAVGHRAHTECTLGVLARVGAKPRVS